MRNYDRKFYDALASTGAPAARKIIPIVLGLAKVNSAIDFGCGDGGWLSILRDEHGVEDILGLDGPWVDLSQLKFPVERFRRTELDQPIDIDRKFDLAISLEAAEHLSKERARAFVVELTNAAPIILFSAAIPGQGGRRHFNEQWQSYWAEIFESEGYRPIDCIRWSVWNDANMAFWYKQNILLYADALALRENPRLNKAEERWRNHPLDVVHPDKFNVVLKIGRPGLGGWLRMAPSAVRRSTRKRLKPGH